MNTKIKDYGTEKTLEWKMKLPWEGFNAKKRSDDSETPNIEKSLTQQGMAEQADINWIVNNYMPQLMPQNTRIPMAGDFTGITDYRTAIEQIRSAQESFMKMPAELRARLNQDPQQFIDWCSDEKNTDEMVKYGLATRKPTEPAPAGTKTETPGKAG